MESSGRGDPAAATRPSPGLVSFSDVVAIPASSVPAVSPAEECCTIPRPLASERSGNEGRHCPSTAGQRPSPPLIPRAEARRRRSALHGVRDCPTGALSTCRRARSFGGPRLVHCRSSGPQRWRPRGRVEILSPQERRSNRPSQVSRAFTVVGQRATRSPEGTGSERVLARAGAGPRPSPSRARQGPRRRGVPPPARRPPTPGLDPLSGPPVVCSRCRRAGAP